MLNINNDNDILEMQKYHRTRDMINLIKFFPEVSPITDLTIVKSYEDYKENEAYCSKLCGERNDTLITNPCLKSIETSGKNHDIKSLFDEVKKIDKDGVLVLFNLTCGVSERYERYAGISIGISIGNKVCIEAVGKGFDGRELSKGISCHERYIIPWDELALVTNNNLKTYNTFCINNENYTKARNERIIFLTSLGISKDILESKIPLKYDLIPTFIWKDVIDNILNVLLEKELLLKDSSMTDFVISGHTEGKRFLPWQMYDARIGGKNVQNKGYSNNCRW